MLLLMVGRSLRKGACPPEAEMFRLKYATPVEKRLWVVRKSRIVQILPGKTSRYDRIKVILIGELFFSSRFL